MKLLLQTNVVFPDGQMRMAGTVVDAVAEGINGESFLSNRWATEHKGPMPQAEPVEPPAPVEPKPEVVETVAEQPEGETVVEAAPVPEPTPEPPKKRNRR